jgi:cytochrome c peroxidase
MSIVKRNVFAVGSGILGAALFCTPAGSSSPQFPSLRSLDATGVLANISTDPDGTFSLSGPFFQSLGTNGRTCGTCHVPSDAFSITPIHLQYRFAATGGTDLVFRPNDGSVCPDSDVSTVKARAEAYRLLLQRGLIRIGLPIPAGADFHLESVEDPYGCATAGDMSLYRRPLPSTNLKFLSAIMWDGREPTLESQVVDATTGHAQGAAPTQDQVRQIVDFESSLFTAQSLDLLAGPLNTAGASGGPEALVLEPFHIGINDVLGADPSGAPFDPGVFTTYDAWQDSGNARRASIARGQAIFNTRPIAISGVRGLNDALNVPVLNGTCTTCHDTPNAGDHSVKLPIDIGVSSFDPDDTQLAYLPRYHIRCDNGDEVVTTDPGRAMITGRCADLGKFKGPILRGLAARPPYFHNGRSRTLADVVDFYNQRFALGLSADERADLIAFLQSL